MKMEKYQMPQQPKFLYSIMWILTAITLLASAMLVQHVDAQSYFMTKPIRTGVVMARAVVLDENGQPILVEYNEDGSEGSVINLPGDYKSRVKELQIIPATEYHQQKKRLDDYRQQYANNLAKDAELLSRQQYEQQQYPTADGKDTITPPKLAAYVKSVLVRGRSNRILNEPAELVLLNFSVDLTQNYSVPEKGSLVLNPEGQVIASSSLNIAPRAGFFGDANEKQNLYSLARKRDDKIFGPVDGVLVHVVTEAFPGGVDVTNAEGKYTFSFFLPPCPGFDFDFSVDVYVDLHYTGFTPNGAAALPYTLRRQSWSMCIGSHALLQYSGNLVGLSTYMAIESQLAGRTDIQTMDFKVDVMFLSGRLQIGNQGKPIPVGETTEYEVTAPDTAPITQNFYDFDGDGKPDTTALGEMVDKTQADGSTKKIFEAKADGKLQAVYLSSNTKVNTEEPDLIRQADTKKNLQANGLLKSISKNDLKKTDILIFRESTGQLVLERRGMGDEEINSRRDTGITNNNAFFYRLMLRGPTDSQLNIGGITRSGSWQEWASNYKMTEPFQKREADHLKSGEWIRVVAINRVTGYMATQRVQLKDASQNSGSFLNVPLQDMMLMPPNLKIWAERSYDVDQGLTKDEERQYLIGAEGAALTSDTYIRVYTEWLDEQGRALPEDLGKDNGEQYGLTGRLAKVASENILTPVSGSSASGSDLANFPIAPGRHTQVLRLNDNLTTPEHFYIHVSGTQKDENPNFGTGLAEGILSSRPEKFTPFLTPLYDENKDWKTYNAYRDIKREQDQQETPVPEAQKPIKPLPAYAWNYRPEYQFSQYQLEVNAINRVTTNEFGAEEKNNILNAKTPLISSSDQLVEVLYSLFANPYNRLAPVDGQQDLLLTLGEQELKIQVGQNKQIRFDNIEKLGALSPEDFLTMRLYTNQDAGNILWEYAFEYLLLDTQLAGFDVNAGRTLYVSADDPIVPLQARLIGYADRSKKYKKPIVVNWSAPGTTLDIYSEKDEDQGVFFNQVKLPPVTGASTAVQLMLIGDESTRTKLPKFIVVPGVPAKIEIERNEGNISVGGVGQKEITFVVRDKNNNLVADGTGVSFFPEGAVNIFQSDDATTNGRASVTVKGGDYNEQAKVVFVVGEQKHTVDLDVRPLRIAINAPNKLNANKSSTVEVTVTDMDGKPAAGVDVNLGSRYGFLQEKTLTTGSNGKSTTIITAPGVQGNGAITAQVALSTVETQDFTVDYASGENRDLEVGNISLIGDVNSAGSFNYERFDGVTQNIFYPASTFIRAQGEEGESVTVNLGDQHDPNLAPLAAYYFGAIDQNIIEDDAGREPLHGLSISASANTRFGAGSSVQLSGDSKLWGDGLSHVGLSQNTGFTLEIFTQGEEGGELINLGQGGQRLSYADMKMTYEVKTSTGTYSVSSNAMFPGRWYQISARYQQGQLELWIDGDRYTATASGNVQYQWTDYPAIEVEPNPRRDPAQLHDLVVAGNFSGRIDNLKWYNWNSQPLVTFTDGSTQKTVTINSSNSENLTIQSTGQLHAQGGNLGLHRLAIHTDFVHQYASVISLDMYKSVTGMLSESEETPVAANLPLSFLFPQAHADFSDKALSVLSWFFPIQEIGAVVTQIGYAITDFNRFDAGIFFTNLLVAATYLPPGRVLQPFAKVLGRLFTLLKPINPKFIKYFAGAFKGIIERAAKGNFDTLWHMLPFFITLAEMWDGGAIPKALEFIAKTVDSGEDVISWVDYLALPAGGWEGEGEIPDVAFNDVDQFNGPMSWIVSPAYAKIKLPKINGKVLGTALTRVGTIISRQAAPHLPDTLKIIVKTLKSIDAKALREYVFNPSLISGALGLSVKKGANAVKAFLTGKTNARINPVIVMATVAYVEWESECGKLLEAGNTAAANELECSNKGIKGDKNRTEINKLYGKIFVDSLNKKFDEEPETEDENEYEIKTYGHGALFHLSQIAYFQLLHRAGGSPIKEIEGSRWVWMYKNPRIARDLEKEASPEVAKREGISMYRRSVDLVIGAENEPEQWVELKSYKALSDKGLGRKQLAILGGQVIGQWSGGNGESGKRSSLHRQFSLDRSAAHAKKARRYNDQGRSVMVDVSSKFKWRFQKFKVSVPNSSQVDIHVDAWPQREKGTVANGLTQDLGGSGKVKKDLRDANFDLQEINGSAHIEYAGVGSLMTHLAALGFKEAAEAIIDAEAN